MKRKESMFEKHIQTGLVTIVSALMLWVGVSVTQSRTDIARLEEKVGALKAQIEGNMGDRYRGMDADRDFKIRDDKIGDLQARITRLEGLVWKPAK